MAEDLSEKIATIVGYAGALAVIFWALLKATGIIHSPVRVEMIPYVGAGASILAFVYKVGRKVEGIDTKICGVETHISSVEKDVYEIKKETSGLREGL